MAKQQESGTGRIYGRILQKVDFDYGTRTTNHLQTHHRKLLLAKPPKHLLCDTHPQKRETISLVHGIQKIFSKLLANRLQSHMHLLIEDVQTGFLKGRQITEGFIYAQQLLHHARKSKLPLAVFKADIIKAFDTVNWDFLTKTMQSLGFPNTWITWMKNAVLTGSSQVMINGLLGNKIHLKRGVRQGDPLSPLLFIIGMDFLARWLCKLTTTGTLRLPDDSIRPCLLYADDALFFVKPETHQLQALKIVLLAFEQISGLAVNMRTPSNCGRTRKWNSTGNTDGLQTWNIPFYISGAPIIGSLATKNRLSPAHT